MAFINLLQAVYPVGAIYISTVNTSPSSLIGGTWTKITNAALRASTSVGYTGSDTHAITVLEMPSHQHKVDMWNNESNTYWNASFGSGSNKAQISFKWEGDNVSGLVARETGGGKQCRLSSVLTTAIFGTELRRFFGGDVNGIY